MLLFLIITKHQSKTHALCQTIILPFRILPLHKILSQRLDFYDIYVTSTLYLTEN